MKIKNILVSQPAPAVIEKSPYNELISKYHIHAQFHPFIKVEGVSLKEFRSQRIEILDHTAVIFTSRTTIDSFFRICEEARITVPEGMKYFCNTEAVALYLQKYIVYRKRKIFFANGTFANFMELLNKHKEENFLLTVSEPHKPEMPVAMEKHHLKFDKVVFARTVSADLSGVNVNDYDMLVFYSPSEITSLINAFPEIGAKTKIATFGHNTTQAALNSGLVVSVMAPSPEAPSMTKALELYAKKVNAGEELTWDDLNSANWSVMGTSSPAGYIYPALWLQDHYGKGIVGDGYFRQVFSGSFGFHLFAELDGAGSHGDVRGLVQQG